jgi:hypothetical protein
MHFDLVAHSHSLSSHCFGARCKMGKARRHDNKLTPKKASRANVAKAPPTGISGHRTSANRR